MGLYARKDSKYWWMRHRSGQGVSTGLLREGPTSTITRANRQRAEEIFNAAVIQAVRVDAGLEEAPREPMRFDTYADWWLTHKLPLLRSNDRDALSVQHLRSAFADLDLAVIDRMCVTEYITRRLAARVGPLRPWCGHVPTVEGTVVSGEGCRRHCADERRHVSANTVNREVDRLKVMLRDAVPRYLTASPLA